jgi:Transglycosylase
MQISKKLPPENLVKRFGLLYMLIALVSLTLWYLWVWLTFPSAEPFPYETQSLFLGVGLAGIATLWRPRVTRRGRVVLGSVVALLALTALGMLGWANALVKSVQPAPSLSNRFFSDVTVAMEDGYFYQHRGFDFEAMHRALRRNRAEVRSRSKRRRTYFWGRSEQWGAKSPSFS